MQFNLSQLQNPRFIPMSMGLAVLISCSSPSPPIEVDSSTPTQTTPQPQQSLPINPPSTTDIPSPTYTGPVSKAQNDAQYRKDVAQHIYQLNERRIFKGNLPPLLPAIAVIDLDINQQGMIQSIRWLRAPRHAPEVMKEIEKTIHASQPFPAPQYRKKVTYTETWLWHKNGQFQLHTLAEGQY
ncbi:MAG: hypothetical protein EXR35_07955 [Limnohabitans sp.]|nr:hypothetical protein [Limnohabitans sp.]